MIWLAVWDTLLTDNTGSITVNITKRISVPCENCWMKSGVNLVREEPLGFLGPMSHVLQLLSIFLVGQIILYVIGWKLCQGGWFRRVFRRRFKRNEDPTENPSWMTYPDYKAKLDFII